MDLGVNFGSTQTGNQIFFLRKRHLGLEFSVSFIFTLAMPEMRIGTSSLTAAGAPATVEQFLTLWNAT
jgi:hypothetical protein